MSKRTRGACCGHTPGRRVDGAGHFRCDCACHVAGPIHPNYGPTPVKRPLWPRDGGCAFGAVKQVECPLVIRARMGNWVFSDEYSGVR